MTHSPDAVSVPSAVLERLDAEIAATQKAMRGHEEAGHQYQADLAAARCYGLLLAREIVGAPKGRPCAHARHRWVSQEEGRNVWVCTDCGAPA